MRIRSLLPVLLVIFFSACTPASEPADPGSEQFFLLQHPAFGALVSVAPMPDWAHGARRQVVTETGAYLFYLKGDDIIGVFTFEERDGRIVLTGTCYRADIEFPESRRTCHTA
jgi:hypothetical protein